MGKRIFLYGLLAASLLILLKWVDYSLFTGVFSFEIYVGIIASIFTILGIWMGLRLTKPKVIIKESGQQFQLDPSLIKDVGISSREYEVLHLMAQGMSNKEIAAKLFISLNTVKTHASSLFTKLSVKRRTQAIQVAKKQGLLP